MNENNKNQKKTLFYDFLSFPNNPEELFSLLYILSKNDNYEIYKAIYNETREIYCIKIIFLNNKNNDIDNKKIENSSKLVYQKLKQETALMKSINNCENITKYYGSFFSFKSKSIWLIYEYCPSGSVYDLMKSIDRPLTEKEISKIINDILHGLIYIHQLNIIHRNIKLTNILLNEQGNAKLNNFSNSIQILGNENLSIKNKNLEEINDTKYDILLLGITCIELIKGLKDNSFNRNKFMDKIKNNYYFSSQKLDLLNNNYKDEKYSNEFNEFVQKCLEKNLYKRPTAFELINHPFIKNNNLSFDESKFINLIKYNIEKIENNKKENFIINKDKRKTGNYFYNSIYSNTKNTAKSNISINNKSSMNISNINNNTNDINTNEDKLGEFRINQLIKGDDDIEYDKYTNKDLYSNIDNTLLNNDDSLIKSLKESAAFGKAELDKKSYEIQKKSLLSKNLFKKEKDINIDDKIDKDKSVSDKDIENNLIRKESDDTEFKKNWEHLNKYEEIFKNKISENNINYDYNKHILQFNNDDDSIDLNNDINDKINIDNIFNNKNKEDEKEEEKYIPFTDIKCDIIQLGNTINKRPSKNSNFTSEYSLKNSLFKIPDNNCNENLQKKFLLSFGNNANDIYNNKKIDLKEKNNKNDISTCFGSLSSRINKTQIIEINFENHKSCKQLIHYRKSLFEENVKKIINNNDDINKNIDNKNINNKIKSDISPSNCESSKINYLYKYLNDLNNPNNPKENEIKNKKSNIIKVDKMFNNKSIPINKKDEDIIIDDIY